MKPFSAMQTLERCARWLSLSALLMAWLLPVTARAESNCSQETWPLWQTFVEHFVQPDGRVLDASTPQRHSSSEGQSYAMFFALVANDRVTFDKLWRWSQDNLAGGDIKTNLPGWFWGLDENGSWRLLDSNSASDADLWFAYALLEAGRLWHVDAYTLAARQILHNVATQEVADLPWLGKMLMPGKVGFIKPNLEAPNQWQLNPSYMPVPILRRFAEFDPKGPWAQITKNTVTLIKAVSAKGYVADWVSYRATGVKSGEFIVDPVKGELGSYDAIRTYLWVGLMPVGDRFRKPLLDSLGGMAQATAVDGVPPEKVQAQSGVRSGVGPFGFSAALLPYFKALGNASLQQQQALRVQQLMAQSLTPEAVKAAQPPYYFFVLSLFSLGFMDNRYHFLEHGKLQPIWEMKCQRAVTP
ncbi:cellulose synthase complex periplasmic endoglucanase BcsZ [Pseudomonas sp. P8_241]|uniref:cellulose synthase complex periplasmic endoglucanase BcsZ n=1 Tax=Pseudomonas sp. P8_241 TaxID=3043445 RepID=UPI002A364510|nr:cellulose synthase complex periplasmic endoglucanase BcsZ [Pseudomonas sp. P8_241]WPN47372.1 cellulose synthase complex periplasmic endoglucanase BcsZ [Pseudomonas sp. P8_241]